MKEIFYTYKFRLKPTKEQEILLSKHFGCVRWAYNYFLNQRKEEYTNNKKSLTYTKQSSHLTQIKKQEETEWLKEVNSQALQYSLKSLDLAYKAFFNKRNQFPKFKKKNSKNSFSCPQYVKTNNKTLIIPKFKEGIKMIMERKIEGEIKNATISRTPTGKYFVTILTEKIHKTIKKTNKSVGIDLGIKDFLVLSNGTKIKNHRFLKHYQKQLKLNQQHLSRKTKSSKRQQKQRKKVAKIYEKITNSRLDLIHKTTLNLIKEYDTICLEDLNIKGMMKRCKPKKDDNGKYIHNGQARKSGLNKSISDVSWGKFIEILTYKAQWNDKEVIHIDRFFPSSKSCSNCGWNNHNLTLKDRTWTCSDCGEKHDRDINAAINILNEGCRKNMSDKDIKKSSAGTVDYKRGAKIRLSTESISIETLKEKTLI